MTDFDFNPLKLREIILNTKIPLVFKNFPLNWTCFKDGIHQWCKTFDDLNASTNLERISKTDCYEPQWERKREVVEMTATQFLEEHSKDCDYWSAINYKSKLELPDKCTTGIDFSPFGFAQAADDATLWLGSSGANTPCHYDSYGCNIVVQVFGKKSWLLLHPNAPLTTTRIPYEESSIYCKENFYALSEDMKKFLETYKDLVYHVILEPKDVLIVPKHWWHYVEAVNISLSVNAWIPLQCDLEQQIEECIVKYLIENLVKNSPLEIKSYVLNPNELTTLAANDDLLNILQYLLDESTRKDTDTKKKTWKYDYHYLNECEVTQLINETKSLYTLSSITSKELENFYKSRSNANAGSNSKQSLISFLEEILINSICSPCIVKEIKNELFRRYKNRTL